MYLCLEEPKVEKWLNATVTQRVITIEKDQSALEQAALHDRYCGLESVERAFRTMKTAHLEMRPVFVRKEKSTKGHVFVVMLALLLQR